MKTVTASLQTRIAEILSNTQPQTHANLIIADLYWFTFADSTQLGLTNHDRPVSKFSPYLLGSLPGPEPYVPAVITRGKVSSKIGIEVDELDVEIRDNSHSVGGVPIYTAAASGKLDGARLQLMAITFLQPAEGFGFVTHFVGRIADLDLTHEGIKLKVRSDLEILNTKMPRYVYQPGCHHTLYDAKCALSKSSFQGLGTVTAGSTATVINSGLTQAAGYFDLGEVLFTSGVNNGLRRSVKSYTPGVHVLANPLPAAPGVGDTFTTYAGCDKRRETCLSKFNNLAKFRAFPYVPTPETAY